ncbi:MAG: M48 family metalloprotease [Pseudomonadota bacterium]
MINTFFRQIVRRQGSFVGALLPILLSACASTSTAYPKIDPAAVAADTPALQAELIEAVLTRSRRVNDIAWPILAANAELCHDMTRDAFGLTIGNDEVIQGMVSGLTRDQARTAGYYASPIVIGVSAGSPAAEAGLRPGAEPIRIGTHKIQGDMKTLIKALNEDAEARRSADPDADPLPLEAVFLQDGEDLTVSMVPVEICSATILVRETDTINASATSRTIRINRGIMSALEDDRELALVIAHELGHVAGRHVPKLQRNAAVSGLVIWGIPVAVTASVVDLTVGRVIERMTDQTTPPGRAAMTRIQNRVLGIRSFEREADYLAVYFAARAGVDLENVESVFRQFATLSARSTYGERTHPVSAERMLAIDATRQEVAAKIANGEPLIPNGWPYPVGESD